MTSSTLYREGDDLDTLLAELDGEFAGPVRVVEVSYPREGGVLGFFARQRVGVHFEVGAEEAPARPAPSRRSAPARSSASPLANEDPLAELLASAEAADERAATSGIDASGYLAESSNAEFAAMVLQLAASKARSRPAEIVTRPVTEPLAFEPLAHAVPAGFEPSFPMVTPPARVAADTASAPARPANPEPAPTATTATTPPAGSTAPTTPVLPTGSAPTCPAPTGPAPAGLAPSTSTIAAAEPASTAPGTPESTAPASTPAVAGLTVRRQLAELGVPIDWVPSDAPDARAALTAVAAQLPVPPRPPSDSGKLLAIVGPAAAATRAAETVRNRLGLDPRFVWTAGDARPNPGGTPLADETYASAFAACHRMGGYRPAVVVVPTDTADGAAGADRMLVATEPDSVWLVVDATSKPADARRMMRARDGVDALVVTGAADTASPATVWELDTPIALLDSAFATPARWVSLLLDTLGEQER